METGVLLATVAVAVALAGSPPPSTGSATAAVSSTGATAAGPSSAATTDEMAGHDHGELSVGVLIDENQRVIIFYTRAVNELTPSGADSYVGGFFYNRDLFPTSGTNACTSFVIFSMVRTSLCTK